MSDVRYEWVIQTSLLGAPPATGQRRRVSVYACVRVDAPARVLMICCLTSLSSMIEKKVEKKEEKKGQFIYLSVETLTNPEYDLRFLLLRETIIAPQHKGTAFLKWKQTSTTVNVAECAD